MAQDFGIIVEGDRKVALMFDKFPASMHDRLKAVIVTDVAELAAAVRSAVPKKTGKLASEVVSGVRDAKGAITGTVTFAAEFAKAGALEYGGTGKPFKVAPHRMTLDHVFATQISPEQVLVQAHTRSIHFAARRFLRGSIEARKAQIESDLLGAVDQVAKESGK